MVPTLKVFIMVAAASPTHPTNPAINRMILTSERRMLAMIKDSSPRGVTGETPVSPIAFPTNPAHTKEKGIITANNSSMFRILPDKTKNVISNNENGTAKIKRVFFPAKSENDPLNIFLILKMATIAVVTSMIVPTVMISGACRCDEKLAGNPV